jgi:hypothetical protein
MELNLAFYLLPWLTAPARFYAAEGSITKFTPKAGQRPITLWVGCLSQRDAFGMAQLRPFANSYLSGTNNYNINLATL